MVVITLVKKIIEFFISSQKGSTFSPPKGEVYKDWLFFLSNCRDRKRISRMWWFFSHLGFQPSGGEGRTMRSSKLPWATHQARGQPELQETLPQKKKKERNNSIRKMNMAIHILNPYTGKAKVRGSTDPGWLAGLHRKALFKRLSSKSVWYLDPQGSVAFCYQAGLIVITLSRPGWFWNV